ncbi:hypothetical protein RUM44_005291 [Polyplax serrata]|uniref:Aminopeptidase n=1 Tax=Polyplax serrata TaxID=468196 RepID=A0ABR1AEK6_POLSC
MNLKVLLVLAVLSGIHSLEHFRLPQTAIPEHYELRILTDLTTDFFYKGKVAIDFHVTEKTDKIVLHSKNLHIFENETDLEEVNFLTKNNDLRWRRIAQEDQIKTASENPGSLEENTVRDAVEGPECITEEKAKESDKQNAEIVESSTVSVKEKESSEQQLVGENTTEGTSTTTQSAQPVKAGSESTTADLINESTPQSVPHQVIEDKVKQPATSQPETNNVTDNRPTTVVTEKPEIVFDNGYKSENHDFHIENEFLTIRFDKPLMPGKKYRLRLAYQGILSDTLTGFHRVPYTKKGSQKSTWLASTVFEPSEARTAFPCFDEPHLKATFDVTLGHDKKFTALSNMPLKSTSPVENLPEYQWSTFERTPRMSTFLVAFLISDLEHLSPRQNYSANSTVNYRFWSRHDVLYKTRYAMKIAPDMKNYMEHILQIRDVLPKHDFIALPAFVSTALENWGLYSFAEKNLLYTPGLSSIFSKFQITQVMAHEISHMWFGNMVTPKWWNQIWLSEGFSNFFEIVAADHVQPNWDLKTTSVIFAYLKVFSLDALHSSHPLVPKFNEPNELNDIFDSISYQKGFYLVRMLNYTLGHEAFMSGVRDYLQKNLLSNVEEDDLWEALNDHAHREANLRPDLHLKDVMYNWTRKAGYPILQVTRDYDNNTASVSQTRFVRFKGDFEFRDNSQDFADITTKWWVPLTYTTGSEMNFRDTKPKIWLDPADESVTLTDMPSKNDFVLMNLDVSGLYRVNYDERNWALLAAYLINEDYSDISVLNRVQIIDDLLDLARSGDIPYERALEATGYLRRETHFLPWKAALSNFDFITRMFRSKDNNKNWKKFVRHLVSPRFDELGFDFVKNESLSDSLNRKQIVKWACKTGLRQCTRKSVSLFKKWMDERRPDEKNP